MWRAPRIVLGNRFDNTLHGSSRDDIIVGFAGDDQIFAARGNDVVFAGPGSDWVDGGDGNDAMFGDGGDDTLLGGKGNDDLNGGSGRDIVDGGDGNDLVYGDSGDDALLGGKGADVLKGGSGRDYLVSGAGRDDLHGGWGADKFVIQIGTGVDTIHDLQRSDRIDLRDFGFLTAQEAIDAFRQQGHNAVLNLGNGDKLIIEDSRVADLEVSQFIVSDAETGPSSSQSPYVVSVDASISTVSLLTVGDETSDGSGWQMVGIPDGLGAFDNGDGTFTVLMNHELSPTVGVERDHGGTGAFVSKLVIDKTSLEVLSGGDLIQHVYLYNAATDSYDLTPGNQFNRLCSADLPELSAFYNAATGKGTTDRIFMNGEEAGNEGRAFAHIVTGGDAGTSYELAWLGNFSWENSVANPCSGDKTVVVGLDDSTPGQVYVYVGDKQATGSVIEKAGLTEGSLFGIKVDELDTPTDANNESTSTDLGGDYESSFSLVNLGNVSGKNGTDLQADSEAGGITEFLRPEDGAWDSIDHNRFYFVTTDRFDNGPGQEGRSRLWALDFSDSSRPELGGTIAMLLDGTEGQQMLDNLTVNKDGKVIIQEDPGSQSHLAKIWEYDPATDTLTTLAQHDPDRFVSGGANFLTQDEESSGIIDVTDILGSAGQNAYLLDVQAHYAIPGELVQGGQLLVMYQDKV